MSLSARRVWIEITKSIPFPKTCGVALRKESVDRNSLPQAVRTLDEVALRKESVDRNLILFDDLSGVTSRSPQGECG